MTNSEILGSVLAGLLNAVGTGSVGGANFLSGINSGSLFGTTGSSVIR